MITFLIAACFYLWVIGALSTFFIMVQMWDGPVSVFLISVFWFVAFPMIFVKEMIFD